MHRKSINCQSCETRCDVIVRQSNYEEEIEVEYCPICSAEIITNESFFEDDHEY